MIRALLALGLGLSACATTPEPESENIPHIGALENCVFNGAFFECDFVPADAPPFPHLIET